MYFKPNLVIFRTYYQDKDFPTKESINRYIVTGTNWNNAQKYQETA